MNLVLPTRPLTVDEFLEWSQRQERGKYELLDGAVIMQQSQRWAHSKFKYLIFDRLRAAIEATQLPFYAAPEGPTVRVHQHKAFEPDALVAPLPEPAPDALEIPNPIIVVEVLSPSTAQIDVTTKLKGYFEVPSVQHYLIVDPDGRTLTHHRRTGGHDAGNADRGRGRFDTGSTGAQPGCRRAIRGRRNRRRPHRMTTDRQQALASLLADARRDGRQIRDLPAALVPETAAEGYAVNALVAQTLSWEPLGWKIAATTPEMQRRLRATEPIYGRSFQRFATPSPAIFRHAELLDPLIECEFFFRLARDLPPRAEPYTGDEVANAVASVHAGVEVAECRFPLDRLPAMPAILADGAANGRYVIGPAIPDWRRLDLADMPVTLTVNGTLRRSGSGREVMEHPLNPLVWLANQRSAWGDGLKGGELISSGTATGMLLGQAGDHMIARFGDVGAVELTLEA